MPSNFLRPLSLLCVCVWLLSACANRSERDLAQQLDRALPTDVLLLGEQHDAHDHQRIHQAVVQGLAERGQLAALALEMADQGHTTRLLAAGASEAQVRSALQWRDDAWPWRAYGPAVMAAVRAGVPVYGANLPRAQMRERMADAQLDTVLPDAALQAQQHAIREGHCDLLPATQIRPMTRVQIARDQSMARTVQDLVRPGQTVLLLAGHGHVNRRLGVPMHLPRALRVEAIRLGGATGPADAEASDAPAFDAVWPAPAAAPKDYCAELKAGLGR